MYEECPALLQMTRTFLEDGEKDEIIHHCKVIRYDPEEENIYLIIVIMLMSDTDDTAESNYQKRS